MKDLEIYLNQLNLFGMYLSPHAQNLYRHIVNSPDRKDGMLYVNILKFSKSCGLNSYQNTERFIDELFLNKWICDLSLFIKKKIHSYKYDKVWITCNLNEITKMSPISLVQKHKRQTEDFQIKWQDEILKRDLNRCVDCGNEERLVVHHIKPVSKFPELMRDLDNGVALCQDCHRLTLKKEHLFEDRYLNYVKEINLLKSEAKKLGVYIFRTNSFEKIPYKLNGELGF